MERLLAANLTAGLAFGGYLAIDENERFIKERDSGLPPEPKEGLLLRPFEAILRYMPMGTPCVMVRRSVLDDVGTAAWTYTSRPYATGEAGSPVTLWGASTVRLTALLATGAIDPSSVAVAGTVVSWVEAGAPAQQDLGTP